MAHSGSLPCTSYHRGLESGALRVPGGRRNQSATVCIAHCGKSSFGVKLAVTTNSDLRINSPDFRFSGTGRPYMDCKNPFQISLRRPQLNQRNAVAEARAVSVARRGDKSLEAQINWPASATSLPQPVARSRRASGFLKVLPRDLKTRRLEFGDDWNGGPALGLGLAATMIAKESVLSSGQAGGDAKGVSVKFAINSDRPASIPRSCRSRSRPDSRNNFILFPTNRTAGRDGNHSFFGEVRRPRSRLWSQS